jgi:uncharacterized C2H2 Zn-finger protein
VEIVEEAAESKYGFCKCPFCSCVFIARADLDRHVAAFGKFREQHEETFRRIHGRAEYE